MSAQTTYKFDTVRGCAGGIVDLAPYAVDAYLNGEENGVMKFGVAVKLDTDGKHIKVASSVTATTFLGVTTNNRSTEYDLDGKIYIRNNKAIGVMRYGRIYVRVASSAVANVKDGVAACVTANGEFSTTGTAVNAVFRSNAVDGIAVVEIFNDRHALT